MKCPCCGAVRAEREVLVDLATNTLAHNGVSIKVMPKVAEFAHVLRKHIHEMVEFNDIVTGLYGQNGEPEDPYPVLKVYVTHLRRACRAIGLRIDTVKRGRNSRYGGYILTFANAPAEEKPSRASTKTFATQRATIELARAA